MDWSEFWEHVSSCDICHALVQDAHAEEHAEWHKKNVSRSIIGGGMFDRG
jgi:hypothetical protein